MKKFVVTVLVCVQAFSLFAAVELNDKDRSIDSVVYVKPDVVGSPLQAEAKKVKIKELDAANQGTISRNIDSLIAESHDTDEEKHAKKTRKRVGSDFKSHEMRLKDFVFAKGLDAFIEKMPVLDQGNTDTCATFSSTAALDIIAANGTDAYSNYFTLKLGHAIAKKQIELPPTLLDLIKFCGADEIDNPWDGSEGIEILKQIETFGVVKQKDKNSQNGKFGTEVKKIPAKEKELNKFEYIANFSCELMFNDNFQNINTIYPTKHAFVNAIKNELDRGNLVSIGLLLASEFPDSNMGMIGTAGEDDNGENVFSNSTQENPTEYNTWCASKKLGKYIKKNA